MDTTAPKKPKVRPSDLLPSVGTAATATVDKLYTIWTGLTDNAPREDITLAGLSFPKLNGELQKDQNLDNTEIAKTVRGSLNTVTADGVRELKDAMARTMFRFYGAEITDPLEYEPGSGKRHVHRPNEIVTIPTAEDVKKATEAGNPVHRYRPHPNDIGVAHFCYVRFTDHRDHTIPPTCAEAGFVDIPDDLDI